MPLEEGEKGTDVGGSGGRGQGRRRFCLLSVGCAGLKVARGVQGKGKQMQMGQHLPHPGPIKLCPLLVIQPATRGQIHPSPSLKSAHGEG